MYRDRLSKLVLRSFRCYRRERKIAKLMRSYARIRTFGSYRRMQDA